MTRASSSEHRLLVLGLLRLQELHGYQLAEIIETHFGHATRFKKATLYDTLKKLDSEGLVTGRTEQQGNRPPRTVYALTAQGDSAFLSLLREGLEDYRRPDLPGDTALMYLEALPPTEMRELLQNRRALVQAALAEERGDDLHHGSLNALLSRHAHHLRAEAAWLDEIIAGLPE